MICMAVFSLKLFLNLFHAVIRNNVQQVERQSFMHIPHNVVECTDSTVDGVGPFGPEQSGVPGDVVFVVGTHL